MESDGEEPPSIPEHLFRQFKTLLDANAPNKLDHVQKLSGQVQEESDGYITLAGNVHHTHMPAIAAWNSTFRKAYTVLFWIRPRLGAVAEPSENLKDEAAGDSSSKQHEKEKAKRVLYRFSTSSEDNQGTGVCVTCSPWKATKQSDDSSAGTSGKRKLQTTLTAFILPYNSPTRLNTGKRPPLRKHMSGGPAQYASFTQQPLTLTENEWHLVGCTHVYPYLKRPEWSICVNGEVLGPTELHYPVLQESKNESRSMDYCSLLQNMTAGGATIIKEQPVLSEDDKKTASQLQAEAAATIQSPVAPLLLDVAAIAVYPDTVSGTVQAILAEAGPSLCQQKSGCIVTTLPPVANWSKGCSLQAGPKVGIPLTVHGVALEVQRLSGMALFCITATHTRILGTSEEQTRLSCPFVPVAGSTQHTPRVGLIQPCPTMVDSHHVPEDELPVLYVTGHCSVRHVLSDYLLHSVNEELSDKGGVTKNWSVAWGEQQATTHAVLPFFLALAPPTVSSNHVLVTESYQHLYSLYSQGGEYAAALIRFLRSLIRAGGARCAEDILQNGTLHILSSSLRLGLIRASKLRLSSSTTQADFVKRVSKMDDTSTSTSTSPSHIPVAIAEALVDLIDVCCGPAAESLLDLPPSMQIRRTSDLALTALFGLALDFDVWGGDAIAASTMWKAIAKRYGGVCVTTGYVLRSQVSVQHFLDRIRLLKLNPSAASPSSESRMEAQESCATSLSQLLLAMLLSSLSNHRSIAQGEKDISSCIAALSDCVLGSLSAQVVISALVGVLVWCDILPVEASVVPIVPCTNEEHKLEVASRFGRNLLMAQFHDVVAPVLLSRTVFSGEKGNATIKSPTKETTLSKLLCWENHWRLTLLIFSWVASIAGPDGIVASQSTGSLLLASGLAGSVDGALKGSNKVVMSTLFMPSPAMALLIGATLRDEWSYKDLLGDRLQIMIPLLPGMVVTLLSPANAKASGPMSTESLMVLADTLTSVGGAFHRVFGGFVHQAGQRQAVRTSGEGSSDAIKAARVYVPHLLVVTMLFETLISTLSTKESGIDLSLTGSDDKTLTPNLDSWTDAATSSAEDLIGEIVVSVPSNERGPLDTHTSISFFRSCQKSILGTVSGLISNAMCLGGAGSTLPLWKSILTTMENHEVYTASDTKITNEEIEDSSPDDTSDKVVSQSGHVVLSKNVICRLVAIVLTKSLKRESQWDVWEYELSSAVSKLFVLVEEKELLAKALVSTSQESKATYSEDQILLLRSLLDILAYGREAAGWCQLALPSMAPANDSSAGESGGDMAANSKILLPVLMPCLRLSLVSIEFVSGSTKLVNVQKDGEDPSHNDLLLDYILQELDLTLTAAIVGLAFSSARGSALFAMSSLRKSVAKFKSSDDDGSAVRCSTLLSKVADELRVRYESERRLRETNLFDAYETPGGGEKAKKAAAGSMAVERLFLGENGVGNTNADNEEITFGDNMAKTSDDFVLFHEPYSQGQTRKIGFAGLEGLGSALTEFKESPESSQPNLMATLSPFLDAWDAAEAVDEKETEFVKLFDTTLQLSSSPNNVLAPGSETAADAISTFFEFAAAEKSRLQDISVRFLPGHRSGRTSFSERFCWARFTEIECHKVESLWERSVPDGNRDVRSRLATLPCSPQFRRYLPKYLDNSSEKSNNAEDVASPKRDQENKIDPIDMDAFTKTLLETGGLEIVDITKKLIEEDDEEDQSGEEEDGTTKPQRGDSIDGEAGFYAEEDILNPETETDLDQGSDSTHKSTEEDLESERLDTTLPTGTTLTDQNALDAKTDVSAMKGFHNITTSSFSTPPDNSSSSLGLMHSAASGMIEQHVENCLHVKAEGNRQCTMLLTSSHLILEYDGDVDGFYEGEILAMQEEADRQKRNAEDTRAPEPDEQVLLNQKRDEKRQLEIASSRPKSIRWNLSEVSHIYLRRYRLRDSSLELFVIPTGGTSYGGFGHFSPTTSLFLDFGPGHEGRKRRDESAMAIMKRAPPQAIKQWPEKSDQFLHDQLSRLTLGWVEGRITNFDYLLHLNILSGRSYNDICQYPVFPWVLADYTSEEIPDLTDRKNFRDLTKPVGALNPSRLEDFIERFNTFADPSIPPFMYGSHYSTSAGVVLHFLVRLHPFAGLHRQLQGGHFDVADRLFSSIPRTWAMCTGSSAAEVKELTPEWYSNPAFLRNSNAFKLGTSQDGEVMNDVVLPPWAKGSPEKFVEVMKAALESDICSEMLSDWVDLIFGRKQQGPEAIKANNVFFYLTYYGTVDVASIEDESLRQATELQIAHFGQCPMQIFRRPHVRRLPRTYFTLSLYQILSAYSPRPQQKKIENEDAKERRMVERTQSSARAHLHTVFGEPLFLPFFSAPLSHWVHSTAPPPGPHAPLVALRFAGTDRCLSVDSKGIFHYFRWAWRPDEQELEPGTKESHFDRGCFVAQRELPRFRTLPRLMHSPEGDAPVAVAISKTLFANRTVLLVLSDGDGSGALGMQLVDPAKGDIKGEVTVPQIHSARITCIATDPIGAAAGHGGVGGELALVGSLDGNASLWRFMSSHYLPLRPRVRLQGHEGSKVQAVALCSAINVAATLSASKCCLHSTGNGVLIRSFPPPNDLDFLDHDSKFVTKFADTPALTVSVQGVVVTVCETIIHSAEGPMRTVVTLNLFSIEGVHLGSKPLEVWRGVPRKMHCTPDGTTVMVCCGRGVTFHRLSANQPLEYLDEFVVDDSDDFGSSLCGAWDLDLGPALNRPVVAAAACSGGALRLHALPGISAWSERHKKSGLTQSVGSALATPARRINRAVRSGLAIGRQISGMGRDLQREVSSDVKERGVGGFLGGISFRKK